MDCATRRGPEPADGLEEGDGGLGEFGIGAERRDRLDDADRRVLGEPLEDRVPLLGDPVPDRLTAHRVGQKRADDGEPVLAPHLGHGQVEGPQAELHVGEGRQRTERTHLLLWRRGAR